MRMGILKGNLMLKVIGIVYWLSVFYIMLFVQIYDEVHTESQNDP